MTLTIVVEPHPLLELGAFVSRFARPLATIPTPAAFSALSRLDATAPLAPSDAVKQAARALLRHGGFRPSGRSKPASEYLVAAAAEARFPQINPGVDACNVVSLHAGLPISLVDVDRTEGGLRVKLAAPGTSYVFNPSGQTIDVGGLICLFDAVGPTGTPVKDAQRTKTHDGTRAALSVVWGTSALAGRTREATRWYRELVATIDGATTEDVLVELA
jgi:DNA/RNA-binding domain of Phe-tRNA-synthetase-like protein